ncbi:MAG TPA: DUF1549 domain-containing protein, partial [Pirellulales bacterium]
VFPPAVKIDSPRRQMQLVVTGRLSEARLVDLTRLANYASTNSQVAIVEQGVVKPVGDGSAEVIVSCGGKEIRTPVVVSNFAIHDPVSFRYGALVALTKNGCNSGACHGSPSGKGGFRLSLRAYDPEFDETTLIREGFNRRTNTQSPEQSLLLLKPLMGVPHGGGRRMAASDPAYRELKTWIAEGLKADPADAPTCVRVEVFPNQRVFKFPAVTQQLAVLAHFSDGTVRDVTPMASFSSSNDSVATVDVNGHITAHDRGEAAILVRYLEAMQTAEMTFLKDVPGFAWPNPPENNYVDTTVFKKLHTLQIPPSELCSDEEFVRRVHLDVLGGLPTPDETRAFLADSNPNKRAALIDALLERPEHASFWGLRWCDLLRINNRNMTPAGVHKFQRWVVSAIREDVPYDRFARELLTATGNTFDNPPANYFRAAADANDCTESTSQLFLGVRIQCAKCHNHPFEIWTQDNYYGIAAFFNRVQRKPSASKEEATIWVAREGEVTQPRTGKQMAPWLPLTGEAQIDGASDDRREVFADWLVKPDNAFFAQVEVNRIWGWIVGRGIVEPTDDFRASNPPSNRELLDALAKDFAENGFQRRRIIRTILNSRVYQLSARGEALNATDDRYFSHAHTRLLSAEQLLDAICQVTGSAEKFSGLPLGTRAVEIPSPDVNHEFLKVFGQPAREMVCGCERSSDSNLSQALQMINGPLVHTKLQAGNNRLRLLVREKKTNEEIIAELYLAALSRFPSPEETNAALSHVASRPDRERALEDVLWAILNAKEFLFQH